MNKNNILDNVFDKNIKDLTDFQLVGIMAEKVKYPDEILRKIEIELKERAINREKLSSLKEEYLSFDTTNKSPLDNKRTLFLFCVLFTLILSGNVLITFAKTTCILVSTLAIHFKFKVGSNSEHQVWNYFKRFYFILIFLVLIIAFLIPNSIH